MPGSVPAWPEAATGIRVVPGHPRGGLASRGQRMGIHGFARGGLLGPLNSQHEGCIISCFQPQGSRARLARPPTPQEFA
jgi:hypothetical protein